MLRLHRYPWQLLAKADSPTDADLSKPIQVGQGTFVEAGSQSDFGEYADMAVQLNSGTHLLELPGPATKGVEAEHLQLGQNRSITLAFDANAPKWISEATPENAPNHDHADYPGFIEALLSRAHEFEEFHTDIRNYEVAKSKVRRRYGPALVTWPLILDKFIPFTDDDPAARGLIVKHALHMQPFLQDIQQGPKKVLQRIHQATRLDRVQEMDTHCLLDYARRPGRNAPEKAGGRQRILAVQRQESHNTLENRVVLDFCHRSLIECLRYLELDQNKTIPDGKSVRKQAVERYKRFLMAYLALPIWADVMRLAEPCRMPNYVLSENPMYVEIWKGYLEILQHADLRERIWRWPRRVWADLVRILLSRAILDVMRAWKDAEIYTLADRPVWVSKSLAQARWFRKVTFPGAWHIRQGGNAGGCLYLLDREELCDFFPSEAAIDQFNADCYFAWVPEKSSSAIRLMPVWSLVGDMRWAALSSTHESLSKEWIENLGRTLQGARVSNGVSISDAMVVHANWRMTQPHNLNISKAGVNISFVQIHANGAWDDSAIESLCAPIRRFVQCKQV